jgi:hypothetical protein
MGRSAWDAVACAIDPFHKNIDPRIDPRTPRALEIASILSCKQVEKCGGQEVQEIWEGVHGQVSP